MATLPSTACKVKVGFKIILKLKGEERCDFNQKSDERR